MLALNPMVPVISPIGAIHAMMAVRHLCPVFLFKLVQDCCVQPLRPVTCYTRQPSTAIRTGGSQHEVIARFAENAASTDARPRRCCRPIRSGFFDTGATDSLAM